MTELAFLFWLAFVVADRFGLWMAAAFCLSFIVAMAVDEIVR